MRTRWPSILCRSLRVYAWIIVVEYLVFAVVTAADVERCCVGAL
jgi:hypothetical protein